MFVTILGRIVGADTDSYAGTSHFTDVKAGHWAESSIAWAAANGIVNGVGNNRFDPNGAVTREQSATILYNFLNSTGYDVSGAGNALASFTDVGTISNYARNAMNWIVSAGIIAGDGTGTIKPKSNAPRSQIAQILMKFANHKAALDGKAALEMPEDATAPVPVEEIPDNGVVEGYEDSVHVQYLPNGKPATTLNVQEILFGLQEEYPNGSEWNRSGCVGYAFMTGKHLDVSNFGETTYWYKEIEHPKFSDVRVGDLIFLKGGSYNTGWIPSGGHVQVVLKVYKDHVVITDGNVDGKVRWGGVLYDYEFKKGCDYVFTPWQYDDIVREPESETYQLENNYQPVNIYKDTLGNGKPITAENIREAVAELREKYPEGTVSENHSRYLNQIFYYMLEEAIFRDPETWVGYFSPFQHTYRVQDSNYDKIKLGDRLNMRVNEDSTCWPGEWGVVQTTRERICTTYPTVLDKTDDYLIVACEDGNHVIHWDVKLTRQEIENSHFSITSAWYASWESIS